MAKYNIDNSLEEYIKGIENGDIAVGKKIRQVYIDTLKPIIDDNDKKYYYDAKPGSKYIWFAEKYCKQSKGDFYNKPIKLMLWQKALALALLGIKHRKTKLRRFTELFLEIGRKNGKSTFANTLLFYLLLEEKGAEVYTYGTSAKIANRIIKDCSFMIDHERELEKIFKYRKSYPLQILMKKGLGDSVAEALANNADKQDGLNASGAIIDEVHALSSDVFDIIKQSMSARKQPLLIMLTTSGFVREQFFDNKYRDIENIFLGINEVEYILPIIYELEKEEEIWNPDNWIKANPGLGVIKNTKLLADNVLQAKGNRRFLNTVLTKDFNIPNVSNSAWLDYDTIEVKNSDGTYINYSDEELKKFDYSIVIGGFDLSRTNDMTAFTICLFDKDNHRVIAKTMYWITGNYYQERLNDKVNRLPFDAWVRNGYIKLSGENLIDYNDIAMWVMKEFKEHGYIFNKIQYDNYSAQYLVQQFKGMGFGDKVLIPTQQGAKTLSVPMQVLESNLRENKLCYLNNPVTKWCLTNVELKEDRNGNQMPMKMGNKSSRKIDGFATILNCYVEIATNLNYYLGEEE